MRDEETRMRYDLFDYVTLNNEERDKLHALYDLEDKNDYLG